MDPAMIAVLATLGGGVLIRLFENSLKKSNKQIDTMVAEVLDESKPVWYDCEMSTERIFEERSVDKGLMDVADMIVCENTRCPNCAPTYEAIANRQRLAAAAEKDKRRAEASAAIATINERRAGRDVNAYSIANKRTQAIKSKINQQSKMIAQLEYENSLSGKQRVADVLGRQVPIPNNVPRRATAFMEYNSMNMSDYLVWTWTLDGEADGQVMYFRQHITDKVFDQFPRTPVTPVASPKYGEEYCMDCETYEVEIDQLLNAPVVFRSGQCPSHAKADDLWLL